MNQEPYCLNPQIDGKQPSLADRIYHDEAKGTAVTTCFVTNVVKVDNYDLIEDEECREMAEDFENRNLEPIPESCYYWRKLTVRECARLQTFPDTFSFEAVSNSRAYKGIGNSWTVDVISHIFSYLLKD